MSSPSSVAMMGARALAMATFRPAATPPPMTGKFSGALPVVPQRDRRRPGRRRRRLAVNDIGSATSEMVRTQTGGSL